MKKKSVPAQYRQGDVIIERVGALPAGLVPAANENGKVILAHGEVTGHHHAFACAEAEKLTDKSGAEFFRVHGSRIQCRLPIIRRWRDQVMVQHPERGTIEIACSDIEIDGDTAVIDGDFGLLVHQEHNQQAIPAGLYRGGATRGTVGQREYHPAEIRSVQD